jgi:UDP-GlcNAc3NAcA epimerase
VLRKETEWIELINNGTTKLVDADSEQLREGFIHYIYMKNELDYPTFYGNCKAAEFILTETLQLFEN